jgi:hypothetical protein
MPEGEVNATEAAKSGAADINYFEETIDYIWRKNHRSLFVRQGRHILSVGRRFGFVPTPAIVAKTESLGLECSLLHFYAERSGRCGVSAWNLRQVGKSGRFTYGPHR